MMRSEEVRKIAVLRANGLGDFLFALPALESLRAAFPQAEVTLLGLPWHAPFLEGRPSPVDRVIVVPPAKGIREEPGLTDDEGVLSAFFAAMEEERFDIAFQMHGGGRHSNPFVTRLKARFCAGLRAPDAPPLDLWVPYVYFQPEIFRYLEVARLAGAQAVTHEPALAVTEADVSESMSAVNGAGGPIAAIVPAAGDGRRRWPPEKFAAVGDWLAARGVRVVIPGIGSERKIIEAVAGRMRHEPQELCGRLSLKGLTGLLSRCALVVGNDSGPLHLAHAVGAPTVGIYWCGNVFTAGPVTRSRHHPVLSWRLECPVCGVNCITGKCGHRESFVADVPVDEVLGAASGLLDIYGLMAAPESVTRTSISRSSYG
jgi:ADP-heptose:LPS heptosyltransferase